MIQLKEIEYTDGSTINVEAIINNFATLAEEIDASRIRKNIIPVGIGSFSCPIETQGDHEVIPRLHPRLDIRSAYAMLGDNVKQSVKISLIVNEKRVGSTKFMAGEKSGKVQIFDLDDGIDMGTGYSMIARTSDARRLVVTVNASEV